MKKIFFIFIIAILGVLAYGVTGTGAWFTSTLQINNNVLATGRLGLKVEGGPFVAEKIEPGAGWKDIGWFCVTNDGDFNLKWRAWFKDVNDPKGLRNFLHLRATLNPSSPDHESHGGNEGSHDKNHADVVLFEDVPFTELMSDKNSYLLVDPTTIVAGGRPFSPRDRVCYGFEARMANDAGDEQQNGTLTARLHVFGTQWIAPW
jgi:predicted ribosomally synthesized peptide with SipW-like signal peptide